MTTDKCCDTCKEQDECLLYGIIEHEICDNYVAESKSEKLERLRDNLAFVRKQKSEIERTERSLLLQISLLLGRQPAPLVHTEDVKVTRVPTPGTRKSRITVNSLLDIKDRLEDL